MSNRLTVRGAEALDALDAALSYADQVEAALKQLEGVVLTPLSLRHLHFISKRLASSIPDRAQALGCFPASAAYITKVLLEQDLIKPTQIPGSKTRRYKLSGHGAKVLEAVASVLAPLAETKEAKILRKRA